MRKPKKVEETPIHGRATGVRVPSGLFVLFATYNRNRRLLATFDDYEQAMALRSMIGDDPRPHYAITVCGAGIYALDARPAAEFLTPM